MEIKTNSPKETQEVALKVAKNIKGPRVIALFGDLGSGKTVFVQGLAKGLGIKRHITSPTFVFMKVYLFKITGKDFNFYHVDLYRGEEIADFRSLGLQEILSGDSVVVLEWAEKIKNILPKKRIDVTIDKTGDRRRIRIHEYK